MLRLIKTKFKHHIQRTLQNTHHPPGLLLCFLPGPQVRETPPPPSTSTTYVLLGWEDAEEGQQEVGRCRAWLLLPLWVSVLCKAGHGTQQLTQGEKAAQG